MQIVDKDRVYKCSPDVTATGFTQLMLCVLNNDLENVSKYLSEINAKNSEGWTALHIACRNSANFSSDEMIDFLLKNGADPNAKNKVGVTPLQYVPSNIDIKDIELLRDYRVIYNEVSYITSIFNNIWKILDNW